MEVSADKCWELVLQRLNQEILKDAELAKCDVKPPHGINGLEMFGLCSPAVIQAIEGLDPEHRCLEYWKNKFNPNGRE